MAVRTDFVAGEVLAAQDLDDTFAAKIDYATPVNTQTGTTYTFVLADGLRLTTANNAAASTFTVPPQSSVVWLANSIIRLVNLGAGAVTINGGSGVTVTNTAATVAQFQTVDCIRTGSDAWTVVVAGGAGGKILQVIFATTSTSVSSSSSSFADTGLTATITPSSASNKVLVLVNQNGLRKQQNTSIGLRLLRDASTISTFAFAAHTNNADDNDVGGTGLGLLDTPATTSAVTYKTQFNSTSNGVVTNVQLGTVSSTIVLMEVLP